MLENQGQYLSKQVLALLAASAAIENISLATACIRMNSLCFFLPRFPGGIFFAFLLLFFLKGPNFSIFLPSSLLQSKEILRKFSFHFFRFHPFFLALSKCTRASSSSFVIFLFLFSPGPFLNLRIMT